MIARHLEDALQDPRRLLYFCVAAIMLLEAGALAVQLDWASKPFVALTLLQGLVYAIAVLAVIHGRAARVPLAFILASAALFRIGPLFGPVIWSSDIYRYVWDGWVQSDGRNPYCCLPSDPVLAHLRDELVYPYINRRETARTIYPPVAEMVFAAQAWLGGSVLTMKAWLLVFEGLGLWAMLRVLARLGRSPQTILIYAWHPLAIWEIAGSGHVDALLVAFVPLGLLAALAGRRMLVGVALGAAILTKFIPAVLFPALWTRWDWRMPFACALFIVVCYLPYLGAGAGVLGYLPGYLEEENLGPGLGAGFWWVDTINLWLGIRIPSVVYAGFCITVLLALGLRAVYSAPGQDSTVRWARVLGLATVLLFSPHYAWYFVWVVVLLTLSPWWPGLWPTLTAVLLYWEPDGGRVPTWVGATIYLGFLVATACWFVYRRVRHDPLRTTKPGAPSLPRETS